MKKLYFALISLLLLSFSSFAQDEEPDNRPVRFPMESTLMNSNPSFMTVGKGQIELLIFHRFSEVKSVSDLFGIFGAANTRLAMNYGLSKKLMLSIATEKNNKMQDVAIKYNIIHQTRSGTVPVFLTYYGSVGIDAREESVFGQNYKFTNRLSYFDELIIGRKFTDKLTIQAAANYSHYNAVDSVWKNDHLGVSVGGRFKVTPVIAAIVEYDQGFNLSAPETYQKTPTPNFSGGIEIGTSTHCFQLFAGRFNDIVYQKNFSTNEQTKFRIGFNITVRFN